MPVCRSPRAGFCLLIVGLLTACGQTNHDRLTDDAGAARFTIVVDGAEGPAHPQVAQQKAQAYNLQTGLNAFWAHSAAARSYVYYGRYASAESPAADKDIKRLKRLAQAGRFRPRFMTLVAIDAAGPADDRNPLNLRNAHPDSIYTMLVGVYDDQFKGDRRAAAEADAQRLRDQNYEGYFLHQADNSLVLVGTYYHGAYRKIDLPDGSYELQLHPYLQDLLNKPQLMHIKQNGAVLESTNAAGQTEKVRSTIIRIPGK